MSPEVPVSHARRPTPAHPGPPTRRHVLAGGAGLGLGLLASATRAASTPRGLGSDGDAALFERGLERLHARLPDANVHRSNHVAMVIEALVVLGLAEGIGPWLDAHFPDYEPDRVPPRSLDAAEWRTALGRSERALDWRTLFDRELADDDWRAVLRRWGPRLVPGLAGAATHGVIRTGHAARSLGVRDNPLRRAELATGLAYWAATYQELPWDGSLAPETSVEAALARVEPRLPARQPPGGNIVAGLTALDDTPSFRPVAGLVDVSDPERTLSEMSSAFARLYLAHPKRRIHFTHSITAPSALRLLAPHLDEECVVRGTRHAWQAAAGLWVVYGDPRNTIPEEETAEEGVGAGVEALAKRAAANGGAHAVKRTEASLREMACTGDAVLERVARDAARNLNG